MIIVTEGLHPWSKLAFVDWKLTTSHSDLNFIADGAIKAGAALKFSSTAGKVEEAGAGELDIIGFHRADEAAADGDEVWLFNYCHTKAYAVTPITKGYPLKPAYDGGVTMLIDANLTATTIKAVAAGGDFGNQPANDNITAVSSAAGDTTQTLTVIALKNGETIPEVVTLALNGTTDVDSASKYDRVYACWLDAVTTGDVELSETSGGLAITTITAGNLTAGVVEPAAASQWAYDQKPTVVAGGASTKYVAIKYLANDGATIGYMEKQLNGTTAATFATNALKVLEVYYGDVAAGSAITVKVGAVDDELLKVGRALETVTSAGSLFAAWVGA